MRLKIALFFVVALVPTYFCEESLSSCESAKITKIGCFNDFQHTPRPLPELVITYMDPRSKKYGGRIFDWEKPVQSMQELACQCAKKILHKNYTYFSLQNFGECWSGKNSDSTYKDDGESDKCLGKEYKKCDNGSDSPCAGVDFTNYVYKAEPIPPTATPPILPPVNKCVDKHHACPQYADLDLCNHPDVLENCPKSCRLC